MFTTAFSQLAPMIPTKASDKELESITTTLLCSTKPELVLRRRTSYLTQDEGNILLNPCSPLRLYNLHPEPDKRLATKSWNLSLLHFFIQQSLNMFCAGSNRAYKVSEICNGEKLRR